MAAGTLDPPSPLLSCADVSVLGWGGHVTAYGVGAGVGAGKGAGVGAGVGEGEGEGVGFEGILKGGSTKGEGGGVGTTVGAVVGAAVGAEVAHGLVLHIRCWDTFLHGLPPSTASFATRRARLCTPLPQRFVHRVHSVQALPSGASLAASTQSRSANPGVGAGVGGGVGAGEGAGVGQGTWLHCTVWNAMPSSERPAGARQFDASKVWLNGRPSRAFDQLRVRLPCAPHEAEHADHGDQPRCRHATWTGVGGGVGGGTTVAQLQRAFLYSTGFVGASQHGWRLVCSWPGGGVPFIKARVVCRVQ